MSDAEFNLLYDNIERMGVTDPILVRPHPTKKGKFRIVGGYHRWEVAKLHGLTEVPVTVVTDEAFDEDMEKFQIVRHNIIHGSMSPQKFMKLYSSLSQQYTEEVASEMFGFTSEEEFRKLVQSTAKSLPKEMQKDFQDAAKEIRTIDDLATVLNRLFTAHGDTVPFNYMIFDFGNQDHVWLRMRKNQKEDFEKLASVCRGTGVTLDNAVAGLLQLIAHDEVVQKAFAEVLKVMPKVIIPDAVVMPTEDSLANKMV
jgi:ParB/RepB/Spo0J family partition protein